jgi:hypothetical protein
LLLTSPAAAMLDWLLLTSPSAATTLDW